MNTNDVINEILGLEKQIESMDDSVDYINNRLNTFYNTENEKIDIKRNIDHLKLLLSKPQIVDILSQDKIIFYNDAIHRGESVI